MDSIGTLEAGILGAGTNIGVALIGAVGFRVLDGAGNRALILFRSAILPLLNISYSGGGHIQQ